MTAEAIKIPVKKCAICGKPATQEYRPFCSRRCADVDLNRWLSGRYVVPAAPDEEQDSKSPGSGTDEEAE